MTNLRASVVDDELENFEQYADHWFDPNGPTMVLQKMIPSIRLPMMLKSLTESGIIKQKNGQKSKILEGIKILDVGSGAGLMCEALANLGAEVVGLDPAEKLHKAAVDHLRKTKKNLKIIYIRDTIESFCRENRETFDAVTLFDVLEHVADVKSILKSSIECLKPNGQIFITTWNKTFIGWFYGIFLLEYVTGTIPRGIHSISMFIKPETIEKMLEEFECGDIETRGAWFSIWRKEWSFTDYKGLFYAMKAIKKKF